MQYDALVHEGAILSRLNHPFIERLVGVLLLEDGPRGKLRVLVVEHLEGGSLEDRLGLDVDAPNRPKPLEPQEAALFGAQIASALAYLHSEVSLAGSNPS